VLAALASGSRHRTGFDVLAEEVAGAEAPLHGHELLVGVLLLGQEQAGVELTGGGIDPVGIVVAAPQDPDARVPFR
jgi:hypothetical protein